MRILSYYFCQKLPMCVPLPFIVLLLLLLRYEKYCFGRRLSNIKLTLYW